jgi:hypothetical protein
VRTSPAPRFCRVCQHDSLKGGRAAGILSEPTLVLLHIISYFIARAHQHLCGVILVAFTFVNLSVIAYFAVRRREYRTFKHITRNIALR